MKNKKSKRGIRVVLSSIVLITVIFMSAKVTRAATLKKALELGNKYLVENKYDEAIVEFEKVIKIDKKNSDIKDTLDILYVNREIGNLIAQGEYEKAQDKINEIKGLPKYEIINSVLSEKEHIILNKGMGNSIQNILHNGRIAYIGDEVFYRNSLNEDKLYKYDIKAKDKIKLSDDKAEFINIYKNYVYYLSNDEIKRIKTDGTCEESLLNIDKTKYLFAGGIQIIDNKLYYNVKNKYENTELNSLYTAMTEGKYSLYELDLNTLQSNIINTVNGSVELYKNDENMINLIVNNGYTIYAFEDGINNKNETPKTLNDKAYPAIILGVKGDNIYYKLDDSRNVPIPTDGKSYIVSTNIKTLQHEIIFGVDQFSGYHIDSGIIGDSYIYLPNSKDNSLLVVDLESKQSKKLNKNINSSLYEVNGYLAYFNDSKELIIDTDIIVKGNKDNKDTIINTNNSDKDVADNTPETNSKNETVENIQEDDSSKVKFDGSVIDVSGFNIVNTVHKDINGDNVKDIIELYGSQGQDSSDRWPLSEAILIKDGKNNNILTSINIKGNGPYLLDNSQNITLADLNNDGILDINLNTFNGGNGSQISEVFLYENRTYRNISDELFKEQRSYEVELFDNFRISITIKGTGISTTYQLTQKGQETLIGSGYYSSEGTVLKKVDSDKLYGYKDYGYGIKDVDGDGMNEVTYQDSLELGDYRLALVLSANYENGKCTLKGINIKPYFKE